MTDKALSVLDAEPPLAEMPTTIRLRMPFRRGYYDAVRQLWASQTFDARAEAHKAKARGPVEIAVRELHATQDKVNRQKMVEVVTDARARAEPILVLSYRSRMLIVDGHHRVYAKRLLGEATAPAYVVEAPPGFSPRWGV